MTTLLVITAMGVATITVSDKSPPGKDKEWEKLYFLGPPCCTEELSPFFSCPPDQGNTSYGKTPRRGGHQSSYKPYWSHVVQVCIFASSVVVWEHSFNHWCLFDPQRSPSTLNPFEHCGGVRVGRVVGSVIIRDGSIPPVSHLKMHLYKHYLINKGWVGGGWETGLWTVSPFTRVLGVTVSGRVPPPPKVSVHSLTCQTHSCTCLSL